MVTDCRSRLVSLPLSAATATSCAREPRGIATFPEPSITSSLTLALYFELASGLAGIAVAVLTLMVVPCGSTWSDCAVTQPDAKNKTADKNFNFMGDLRVSRCWKVQLGLWSPGQK